MMPVDVEATDPCQFGLPLVSVFSCIGVPHVAPLSVERTYIMSPESLPVPCCVYTYDTTPFGPTAGCPQPMCRHIVGNCNAKYPDTATPGAGKRGPVVLDAHVVPPLVER